MFHESIPKQIFLILVDKSNIWTWSSVLFAFLSFVFCWLSPFLKGDRELVLHKNSALMNELVRNLLRREWFAIRSDCLDIVLYALLQLFVRASFRPFA